MEWQLRLADQADAVAVADLLLASRHASVPAYPPLAHPDHDVRRWVREELLPENDVWLACSADGELAAFLALAPTWVEHLHVRPAWTGQGWGTRLLQHAKQLQPGGLQLWVFVSNAPAIRFYERYGFQAVEYTDGASNDERQPDVRYVWPGDGSSQLA